MKGRVNSSSIWTVLMSAFKIGTPLLSREMGVAYVAKARWEAYGSGLAPLSGNGRVSSPWRCTLFIPVSGPRMRW